MEKGFIFKKIIDLLNSKNEGEMIRYTYLMKSEGTQSYLKTVCSQLVRCGYLKRVKNGVFIRLKNINIKNSRALKYLAYNKVF